MSSISIIVMQIVDNNPLDPFAPKHDTIYIMDHDIIEEIAIYGYLYIKRLCFYILSTSIPESLALPSVKAGRVAARPEAFL